MTTIRPHRAAAPSGSDVMRHVALLLSLVAAFSALAHPMPESTIALTIRGRSVEADLRLPREALSKGFGKEVGEKLDRTTRSALSNYIRQHLSVIEAQGRSWTTSIESLRMIDGELAATVRFVQPRGAAKNTSFKLRCDLIVHELLTHKIAVSAGSQLVGRFTHRVHELEVSRPHS